MKSLVGSNTSDNLARAFAGESQARNRYTIYGGIAEKEGHIKIASIFRETAENERAHAQIFFEFLVQNLGKSTINVEADYPIGLETTEQNLLYAAEGEKEEWEKVYPSFAEAARQEGFPEIEVAFKKIVEIEREHEKRFLNYYEHIKNGTLYKEGEISAWKCTNCGYVHEGLEAPWLCPACKYPQGYFEFKCYINKV